MQQQICEGQSSSSARSYNGSAPNDTNASQKILSVDKASQRTWHALSLATNELAPACPEQRNPWSVKDAHSGDGLIATRLVQFLQSYSKPFGIRCQKIRNYKPGFGSMCYWYGPTIYQRWTEQGEERFGVMPRLTAYGIRVTVRSPLLCSRTLNLWIYAQSGTQKQESLSVQWSLSFPSVVPESSAVMRSARDGDVKSVMALFEGGEASYSDTAPNGTSLLHVRLSGTTLQRKITDPHRLLRERAT